MSGVVSYAVDAGIATIRISNPGRRNALSPAMIADVIRFVDEAEGMPSVRVIAITGADGHFCAGADLTRFEEVEQSAAGRGFTAALTEATKPTVAIIEGVCIGGGALLALACDLRLCSATARFGLPPSRLGILFPLETVVRIVEVVGPAPARDLLYSARIIDAAEAARIGLVNGVFAADELAAAAAQRLSAIAQNAPRSVRRAKAMIAMVVAGQTADTAETLQWVHEALHGPDMAEGKAAFLEKRPPRFDD